MTKTCCKCLETKPVTEFYRRKEAYQHLCKKCHLAQASAWKENMRRVEKERTKSICALQLK